jgi:hypothetical protein
MKWDIHTTNDVATWLPQVQLGVLIRGPRIARYLYLVYSNGHASGLSYYAKAIEEKTHIFYVESTHSIVYPRRLVKGWHGLRSFAPFEEGLHGVGFDNE